ncbi:COG complex component [Obba rivulosa]|uniref:Conserved oligomeric Golgi complex subunit 2 n=1 Tax=Obba rivulosa TaxID=1052685 RepID=A0A8E2DQF0_9APHY|nr:COG complex component [Obba rivulosa]
MPPTRSPEAGSSRDPFELERLAEELAVRERSSAPRKSTGTAEDDTAQHELPIFIPLSHDNPHLSADPFNVEEFLLSRAYTSLPDLRSELREYLATLKEELVKLINDDYEAFISLSTDLRGEGARLERLKKPLGDLRAQVVESRQTLQGLQDAIQAKLDRRSALREEKAFLHLLLKISESITRLESLLLIASPPDANESTQEMHTVKMPMRGEDDSAEERARGSRAKHLARVGAEYTQLLYHVSRACTGRCAFVEESQWRIDRIKSTLSSDLDHLFAATVTALVTGKEHGREVRATEAERSKWMADITECLKTYDTLGLWRDAEDVLRREVVRSFVKKNIHPGALTVPRSPIAPHTPFACTARSSSPLPTASHPPRTPYTPFTAFASKQNPFEFRHDAISSPGISAHMLDDRDDSLAALYNTVLKFIDRDLKRIMEVAETVCVKSGLRSAKDSQSGNPAGSAKPKEEPGFEIMANVIWAEIGRAIMDELGSVVFAAGKPDEFRKHYETTQAFIRALEFLAPSVHAIEAMRGHLVYIAFERRWQLPVYFQLRWKEIVSPLEDKLAITRLERSNNKALEPFVTPQAAAIWEAISTCWSAEVYIPELAYRFWRLTLQLLNRHRTWLDSSIPAFEPPPKIAAAAAAEKAGGSPSSLTRASTPNPPTEAASPEATAADELLLQQFATAIVDIKAMESKMWNIWREELSMMLPDLMETAEEDTPKIEDILKHALSKLTSLVQPLSSQIVYILARRACDALLSMRSIPSQFRAMSSKRMPAEPSHFVSLIFRPLRAFFAIGAADGPGAALKNDFLKAYSEDIFEIVAQRYIYFLSAMKKTEESLRRLKKGKKSAFSFLGGSGASRDDDGRADEEKIRAQMILDVEAFGREAESLGVVAPENETFKALEEMARAPLTDES